MIRLTMKIGKSGDRILDDFEKLTEPAETAEIVGTVLSASWDDPTDVTTHEALRLFTRLQEVLEVTLARVD